VNPREFCYWLQGYLEISASDKITSPTLTTEQVACVQKHLDLVFTNVTKEQARQDLPINVEALCGSTAGAGLRLC
jgi:hypothetical protein